MCGRFACFLPPEAIARLFQTSGTIPNRGPTWNLAPTQDAMLVRWHAKTSERRLDTLKWGLIPHYTREQKAARNPINARAETASGSGMFKAALASRRALVPMNCFYEWRSMPDGKQPYAIARQDSSPLALAGLWESWKSPGGEIVRSFAILTTQANVTMKALHHRMPVVVEEKDWATWLGEREGSYVDLMRPAVDHMLTIWPVSRAVNSVRNDEASLMSRIDDPAATPLNAAPPGPNPA